jgi:hypothetical protein
MKDKLFLVLAFSLLALGGYGGYLIFLKITDALKNVDPNVSAALIAGVITIIFSVFIASYNSRKAIERTAFEAHRENKASIYNEFTEIIIQLMPDRTAEKLSQDIEELLYRFTAKITIYGSPSVIKAYGKWRVFSDDNDEDEHSLIDDILREIRVDLGESNEGLESGELISLFAIGGSEELVTVADKAVH